LKHRFEELIAYWKRLGLKTNGGADLDAIQALEDHVNFRFPTDFKAYLLQVNGMVDFEWDKEMISFWSIDRMRREFDEVPSTPVCFADFLISSHAYGFYPNEEKVYTNYGPDSIANSFTEFIDLYLNDGSKLFK
jgi:hypothetical protein